MALGSLALALGLGGGGSAVAATTRDPVAGTGPAESVAAVLETEPAVTLVQRLARPVVLESLRESSRTSPKGTDLWQISLSGDYGVPQAALRAYQHAAAVVDRERPACQMPWTLLAGIGRVESDHGRYGGSRLGADGVPRPAIRGVALNGAGPVAAIPDTDNGRWDGDKVWDRAVGPMQFIPATWRTAGRDGDGDGVANPNDIDDAALAAAEYLCPDSGSILPEASMRAAILSYNNSSYYVDLVMAFARGYRTGVFDIPPPPPPPPAKTGRPADRGRGSSAKGPNSSPAGPSSKPPRKPPRREDAPQPGRDKGTGSTAPEKPPAPDRGGDSGGKGDPGRPKPTPTPSPSPSPPAPTYSQLSGQLSACTGGWCLDGTRLDLGSAATLSRPAAADYDGDGTLETNGQELAGLDGATVRVQVQDGTSPLRVTQLQGRPY